jgi:hypothetical protein
VGDEHLRALERSASQGGSEAEARLLRERQRAGSLSAERLALAAYLGHEGALLALGETLDPEDPDLREWLWGFMRWGRQGVTRALVAACSYGLQCAPDHPRLGSLEDALETISAWCDDREQGLFALESATEDAGEAQFDVMIEETAILWHVGSAVWNTAMAAWKADTEEPDKPFLYKAWEALDALVRVIDEAELRAVIRSDLTEWALRDPSSA